MLLRLGDDHSPVWLSFLWNCCDICANKNIGEKNLSQIG